MNGEDGQMGYCAHENNLEVHILVAANNYGNPLTTNLTVIMLKFEILLILAISFRCNIL